MNRSWILGKVDHTLLTQTATWEEVKGFAKRPSATKPLPFAYHQVL